MYAPNPTDLLSFLLSRTPLAVAMCDRQLRYLHTSQQWRNFYGLAAAEESRNVPQDKLSPKKLFPHQPERFAQLLKNCLAGSNEQGNDGQFISADGEVIPLKWEMQPWRHRNGKIGGAIVLVEAIAPNNSSSMATSASETENSYRLFIEQAADSIFITNFQGHFVSVNAQACQMLGYTKSELLRLSVPDITSPSHRARIADDFAQILAGETICLESQLLHQNGTLFPVEVKAKQLGNNLIQAIVRDISSRVQMETALRASEARFQKLAANVPGAIYQFIQYPDGVQEVLYISGGCRELYELEPEAIQQNMALIWATFNPEDLPELRESIALSAANLTPWHHEMRCLTASGKQKWIEGFSRPEKLTNGAILWDGLLIDITQRKQAEIALRQYRENLEELVTERTRKLTAANEQLQAEIQERQLAETERQLAEAALEHSQERFTKLAANVPGMIFQYVLCPDGSHYFSYVSPGCRELYELAPEIFSENATYVLNLVHPEEQVKLFNAIQVSAATVQPWNMEFRIVTRSGVTKWIQGVSRPEKQENGDIIWDGLLIDISDRKQAEQKLQQTEARMQKLAANVPGMLYQFALHPDGSNSFYYISSGCRDIYELEPEAIEENSDRLWSLVHPEDFKSLQESIAISAKNLTPWHHEHRIVTTSGKLKWIRGASRPELQPNGDIIWDGLVMDISDRKAADKAIQESENKFRYISEMAPIPIVISRLNDGSILYANEQLGRALGISAAECLGRTTLDFYYDIADRQKVIATFSKEGYVRNYEMRFKKPNGNLFWVSLSSQALILNNDEVLLSTFSDITERKQAEQDLQVAYQQAVLLKQITEEIRASLDTKQILQITVERVGRMFGASRCLIHIYKSEPFIQIPFVAEYVAPGCSSIFGMELKVDGNPHLQQILAQDRAIASDNVYDEPLLKNGLSICRQVELKSMLAIRTSYQGQPNGVLVLHQCDRFRHWQLEEIELFEAVANQLGIALFQAQLLEQQTTTNIQLAEKNLALKKSEARFRKLAQKEALINCLSSQIRQSLDLDTVLEIAVTEIRALLQVDRCQFVWYYQEDNFSCYRVIKESRNLLLESHLGVYKLSGTSTPNGLLAKELLKLDDSSLMYDSAVRELFLQQNYRAVLSLPIQARSGEVGFVNCSHTSLHQWHDDEVELLQAVGDQLAIAIDQAELYKQTRQAAAIAQAQAQRQESLNCLVSQIRASLDLHTILETAVSEVYKLLQPDRCIFVWYHLEPYAPYSEVVHEVKKPEVRSLLGMRTPFNKLGIVAQRILNKQMFRIDDVETLSEEHFRKFFSSIGCRALLVLPIHTQSGEVGLISCAQIQDPRTWSDDEVELLQNVADQIAIAASQAELYKQTRQAAEIATEQATRLKAALQELKKAQTHLIQSEKMSSLGQMVAGIAHEINNPVSFIYGNIEHANGYIEDFLQLINLYQQNYPQPTKEIQEFLDEIDLEFSIADLPKVMNSMKIGATRIRDIVRSLRSFSRLDEADLKPVSLHEGIDNTLLILEHRLKANASRPAIEVIKEYGELPLIECYAGQLNQVFMNLLSNAIDALEEKITQTCKVSYSNFIPTISIYTEAIDRDWIICRIVDNGSGISDEVMPRLFDPFFTTKPVGYGTGMGLAISYQIVVERHQGRLSCRSQLGSHTEFIIEIPRQRSPSP